VALPASVLCIADMRGLRRGGPGHGTLARPCAVPRLMEVALNAPRWGKVASHSSSPATLNASARSYDHVSCVEEPFRLVPKANPVLLEGRHVLADSVVAPNRIAAERCQVRMPCDF
jgi:hypothetical protein